MKKWRTLVRVVWVDSKNMFFGAVIPGWKTFEEIIIYIDDLPEDIRPLIVAGKRLHAKGYIEVNHEKDLELTNWERE